MKSPKTDLKILENNRRYRKTKKGILTNIYHHQKERCKKNNRCLTYTLDELQKRFIEDKKFNRIYKKWVKNGYKYYDKPSIDRKDVKIGYTMDNIQIMSWQQNRRKGELENSRKTTEVIMMDMEGRIIKIFPSIKEAVIYTECHQGLISACCNNKRNHTGGYKWEYGSYRRK